MTNWQTPAEITLDNRISGAFTLVLCGVAAWDVLRTISFDISIIARRRPWRWPMLLYLILRIDMLSYIFAYAVKFNTTTKMPCQPLTFVLKILDAIGTCGSSFILVLRTRAVWQRDVKVTVGLGILSLAQIVLWANSLTLRWSRSAWDPKRAICAVVSTTPTPYLVALHSYTMAFDLLVLILCLYRLWFLRKSSTLAHVVFRDGIGYFCAAFAANFVQAVMAALGLNPVMIIIMLPFALVVSVIASTTVFRNVFIAYDGFEDNSENWTYNSGSISRNGTRFLQYLSTSLLATFQTQRTPRDVRVSSTGDKSLENGVVSRGAVNVAVDTVLLPPTPVTC